MNEPVEGFRLNASIFEPKTRGTSAVGVVGANRMQHHERHNETVG